MKTASLLAKFSGLDAAALDARTVCRMATIKGAQIYLEMKESRTEFGAYAWGLAGGKPIQTSGPLPASTPLSERISKDLKQRGFKFVGPVIVYSWMQAAGMVNDHAESCFRRGVCKRMKTKK